MSITFRAQWMTPFEWMWPYWDALLLFLLFHSVWIGQAGSVASCINVVSLFFTHPWHCAAEQGNVNYRPEMKHSHLPKCILLHALSFHTVLLIFSYPTTHRISWSFATTPQVDISVDWCFSKTHRKTTYVQTHKTWAAGLTKNLCCDGYLASDSDLSVIIWPLCLWGKGQGKGHSFGLCTDHWGTLGPLSVCRLWPENETFYFPNLVK